MHMFLHRYIHTCIVQKYKQRLSLVEPVFAPVGIPMSAAGTRSSQLASRNGDPPSKLTQKAPVLKLSDAKGSVLHAGKGCSFKACGGSQHWTFVGCHSWTSPQWPQGDHAVGVFSWGVGIQFGQ